MNFRFAIACALALLPGSLRVRLGRLLLGWDVHPTARIGHSVIGARKVTLGAHARISSLTMVKGIEELRMGDNAIIGQFNWISGPPLSTGLFPDSPSRNPSLIMGYQTGIVQRHLIDCSDEVRFDDYAYLAGSRTTILTHSVTIKTGRQQSLPVRVGHHTIIMTGSTITAGVQVPEWCVLSAGCVVVKSLPEAERVYQGNPAVAISELSRHVGLFNRDWSG